MNYPKLLIATSLSLMALFNYSCEKPEPPEVLCLPPGSEELFIVLEDSAGNNIIQNNYPGLILTLTDNQSSFQVSSSNVNDGTIVKRAWNFNIDQMISGYPYLLEYDSNTVDTLSVFTSFDSTLCNGTTFFYNQVDSIHYNDTTVLYGGVHTIVQ